MKNTRIIAMLLCAVIALCLLSACGGKEEAAAPVADTTAPIVPAVDAEQATPADGDSSSEMGASGDPGKPINGVGGSGAAEPYDADWSKYSKDWDGYMQYALDAFDSDANVPANLRASLEMAENEEDQTLAMLQDSGRIMNCNEFLAQ